MQKENVQKEKLQKEYSCMDCNSSYSMAYEVVQEVAAFYGLTVYEVKRGRSLRCSKARKMAAYILRIEKNANLDEIARQLGRSEKSSILHMIITFTIELQQDKKLQEELSTLSLLC